MGMRQKQREDKLKESKPEKRSFSPKRPQPPTSLPLLETSSVKVETSKKKVVVKENTSEFITEALREAVSDFENYLDKSSKEKQERPMYRSAARAQRYRQQYQQQQQEQQSSSIGNSISSPDEPGPSSARNNFSRFFVHQSSTSSLCSSISTTSSANLYPNYFSSEAVLAELPSSVPVRLAAECMETDSNVSLNSEMSTNTLRNIREHIAKSLIKLKEYEKQVKTIFLFCFVFVVSNSNEEIIWVFCNLSSPLSVFLSTFNFDVHVYN